MSAEIQSIGESRVAAAIEHATEPRVLAPHNSEKPRLFVEKAAPDRTVAALRDILAKAADLYDRGAPVRIVHDQSQNGAVAQVMTPEGLILLTHRICRPYALKVKNGNVEEVDVQFPRSFAVMYLDWRGEWRLPILNGIASAPLLADDGTFLSGQGYDRISGMWREHLPDLSAVVPEHPSQTDAEIALQVIRSAFKTFCFADACLVDCNGMQVVDLRTPPGRDESAFLAALLTAVCRPSLDLAPGVLIRAAQMSGAGAGKGLLARCISKIAFGREPHAVTGGHTAEELEKRISAELMEGNPVFFLDNLNNTAFRSNLLASAITERPARVRLLGRSQMVPLNPSAFVVLTGNGLSVSEDLARRFIVVELDPHTEDPESREFPNNIQVDVERHRISLLAAALTIWRWGRLETLAKGLPLGSFERWCRWVRDPLVALGCMDPVERIGEAKQRDGRRQVVAEVFTTWYQIHGDESVTEGACTAGIHRSTVYERTARLKALAIAFGLDIYFSDDADTCEPRSVSGFQGAYQPLTGAGPELVPMLLQPRRPRPRLLITEAELGVWLAGAKKGDRLEYHRGFLAIDRISPGSRMPLDECEELQRVAKAAFAHANGGRADLVQRRLGPGEASYLIVARRRPVVEFHSSGLAEDA